MNSRQNDPDELAAAEAVWLRAWQRRQFSKNYPSGGIVILPLPLHRHFPLPKKEWAITNTNQIVFFLLLFFLIFMLFIFFRNLFF